MHVDLAGSRASCVVNRCGAVVWWLLVPVKPACAEARKDVPPRSLESAVVGTWRGETCADITKGDWFLPTSKGETWRKGRRVRMAGASSEYPSPLATASSSPYALPVTGAGSIRAVIAGILAIHRGPPGQKVHYPRAICHSRKSFSYRLRASTWDFLQRTYLRFHVSPG